MTTLHEQARAEAEKRWPDEWDSVSAEVHGQSPIYSPEREPFIEGFLAGHEAATRTRVVTTAADLEALPVKSIFRCRNGSAWEKHHDGTWNPAALHVGRSSERMAAWLPGVVLYDPEETR